MKPYPTTKENSPEKDLSNFLKRASTPWHTIALLQEKLKKKGFRALSETQPWSLEAGCAYYCNKDDSALIAFRCPEDMAKEPRGLWIASHVDSPGLRPKPKPIIEKEGFQLLDVEVYGSPLLHSWIDRDLKLGGRLIFRKKGKAEIHSRLWTAPYKLCIPQLAIHLNREVNKEGFKLNAQNHIFPLLASKGGTGDFWNSLYAGLKEDEELLDFDLTLFDSTEPSFLGMTGEFLQASRLDDLAMVHASLKALAEENVKPHKNQITGCMFFNHEEVGSGTINGADSFLFQGFLERLYTALGKSRIEMMAILGRSFLISADMAHALHPQYPEKHDKLHKPLLNGGPVIKWNENARYTTTGKTAAQFRLWAADAGVRVQDFSSRNDLSCGSTIGPVTSCRLGMPALDVGNPMLSMHSLREMAGVLDHRRMIQIFTQAFHRGL